MTTLQLNERKTNANNKFMQKWLTVVQFNSSVIYLIYCGTTMVLQVMPVLHKLANRCKQG